MASVGRYRNCVGVFHAFEAGAHSATAPQCFRVRPKAGLNRTPTRKTQLLTGEATDIGLTWFSSVIITRKFATCSTSLVALYIFAASVGVP